MCRTGGLYQGRTEGRMVAPFRAAALALEPGQIAPELVETDFGFHIIKLERKGETRTRMVRRPKHMTRVIS